MTTPLPILPPHPPEAGPGAARRAPAGSWRKELLLRTYRLAVIVAIVWCVRQAAAESRANAGTPVKVEEVQPFLPAATGLRADTSDRAGIFLLDKTGATIGYAVRTMPNAEGIRGYAGPIDTLIVMDAETRVLGIRIRSTSDTTEHVEKVKTDEYSAEGKPFMTRWNGKRWDELAGMPAPKEGWDIVAGASLTSGCIINSVYTRFQKAPPKQLKFGWHDFGLVAVLAVGLLFTFTHLRSRTWLRRAFQLVLIGYLGIANGQILAQSLFGGWAASGAEWRAAPALVLLAAMALIIPWVTRRQLYCSQICPHGAAQELIGRIIPWRLHVPKSVDRGLRWLPALLIALVIFVVMFQLVFNLADIEPFNAYQFYIAGIPTIAVAIVGLVVAAFVPMAYCKYGCPTGALLSFVRSHGKADGFGRRDIAAGSLVAFAAILLWRYENVHYFLTNGPRLGGTGWYGRPS
jgi:hypothetical protein